jgi:hypothetical protein
MLPNISRQMNAFAKLKNPLIVLVFICVYKYSTAQESKVAKNFPGVFAGVEWNTISGSWGVDYERLFYTRNKLAIGAKIGYITSYDYGNMELLNNPCCESTSHVLLSGTGIYYTGKTRNFTGFFLHSALGAGFVRLKYASQSYNNERNYSDLCLNLDLGCNIRLEKHW